MILSLEINLKWIKSLKNGRSSPKLLSGGSGLISGRAVNILGCLGVLLVLSGCTEVDGDTLKPRIKSTPAVQKETAEVVKDPEMVGGKNGVVERDIFVPVQEPILVVSGDQVCKQSIINLGEVDGELPPISARHQNYNLLMWEKDFACGHSDCQMQPGTIFYISKPNMIIKVEHIYPDQGIHVMSLEDDGPVCSFYKYD